MALIAGTALTSGGGTGLAQALYNARLTTLGATYKKMGLTSSPEPMTLQNIADNATCDAAAIIGYLVANAAVTIPLATNQIASGASAAPMNLGGTIA